jgi:hypothetical protein
VTSHIRSTGRSSLKALTPNAPIEKDSNLRMAESKSPDKAKGRKDRNVRLKDRPCNPSRQTTAAPGSSPGAANTGAKVSLRRKPPRIERFHLRQSPARMIPSRRRPGVMRSFAASAGSISACFAVVP